jgi:hypothetical protein
MFQRAGVIFLVLVLSPLATYGEAGDKPIRAADVPREFKGTFGWGADAERFDLALKIDKLAEKDGVIQFSGSHLYTPGDFKMKIDGTIDAKSGRVTIRESDPSRADSETDGEFAGTISRDGRTLEAVWTTSGTEKKGDLKVKASN